MKKDILIEEKQNQIKLVNKTIEDIRNELNNNPSEEQQEVLYEDLMNNTALLDSLEDDLSVLLIADKIKKARLNKKLTLKQVADNIGVTPQLISQYERGLRKPKKQTFDKILKALDCTYEDLNIFYSPFGLIDLDYEQSNIKNIISETDNSNKIKQENMKNTLLNIFGSLTDKGKQKVIDYSLDISENPKYKL